MGQIITEGDSFYDLSLQKISAAEKSVLLNMNIFRDDDIGRASTLAQARQGIRVILIYDRVGSMYG